MYLCTVHLVTTDQETIYLTCNNIENSFKNQMNLERYILEIASITSPNGV